MKVRDWLERGEVNTLSIEPGSLWEKDHIESFNGKLRDELTRSRDRRHAVGGKSVYRTEACRVQHGKAIESALLHGNRNYKARLKINFAWRDRWYEQTQDRNGMAC